LILRPRADCGASTKSGARHLPGKLAMRCVERFALEKLARQQRFGIAQLVERVRWDVPIAIEKDDAGFRLNNNHRAYIARELIDEIPLASSRRVKRPMSVSGARTAPVSDITILDRHGRVIRVIRAAVARSRRERAYTPRLRRRQTIDAAVAHAQAIRQGRPR
jgi:hypothetical protein